MVQGLSRGTHAAAPRILLLSLFLLLPPGMPTSPPHPYARPLTRDFMERRDLIRRTWLPYRYGCSGVNVYYVQVRKADSAESAVPQLLMQMLKYGCCWLVAHATRLRSITLPADTASPAPPPPALLPVPKHKTLSPSLPSRRTAGPPASTLCLRSRCLSGKQS